MTTTISAIVLKGGKINGHLLERCLKSLSFADEKIIVDTSARKGSFADWRNYGAGVAKSEWLFYVDTDEEVGPELAKVIQKVVKTGKYAAYAIPRRNFVFGREMKHCGLSPDFVLRLIKKDKLEGWFGELHEQPRIDGKICHLETPLIHTKHRSLADMVDKTNEWSEIEARLMYEAGHPGMNAMRFFSAGFREFWKRMIVQTAFLDGTDGIVYGIYQVFSRLISYSKLWEMQLRSKQ